MLLSSNYNSDLSKGIGWLTDPRVSLFFFFIRVTSRSNCATESRIVTPRKNISVPERLPTLIINCDNLFSPPPHTPFFFFLRDVVTDFYFQLFVPQWHDQSGEYLTVMKR